MVWNGSFLECWKNTNVTAVPKGPHFPGKKYRPISTTVILSKVFEKDTSHKLSKVCERNIFYSFLLNLLFVSHHLQKTLDVGFKADFHSWISVQPLTE